MTHEDLSADWIERLVQGDPIVVQEFWDSYGPRLRRLADSRMSPALQQRLAPEDVVQSVCRSFFRRIDELDLAEKESDCLWRLLCAMTLHKVREHARFHRRERRSIDREQSLSGIDAESGCDGLADPSPTPDEAVAFADEMRVLLEALDEQERRFVELKLEGHFQDTIAERLNCSERTVRRIQESIRERWEKALGVHGHA